MRYVDDFLLFADDKETLWSWKRAIEERLAALRLTISRKLADYQQGRISEEAVAASAMGWLNHIRFGNTAGLRRALLAALPREILDFIK